MALVVRKARPKKEGAPKPFKKFTVSITIENEDYGDALSAAIRQSELKDGAEIADFIDSKL